jgi:monoamine oxidase
MTISMAEGLEVAAGPQLQQEYDVVIIGAGMSGLYSAWRIASDWQKSPLLSQWAAQNPGKTLRIAVIEWSMRVGGRIDSRIIANMTNVPAELGGMRFTTSHEALNLVVKHFNLPTQPFPMSSNRQYLLRGTRTSENAMKAGATLPYALAADERNMTPDQVTNLAIKRVCNYSDKWSDANWQWIKENFRYSDAVYPGTPLYDTGFWNLLMRVVSNEGYDYVWDGGGYNSNTINWNGAEAMPYMLTDFSQQPNFFRITAGFHTLPAALARSVLLKGVSLIGGIRLTSFEPDGDFTRAVTQKGNDPTTQASFRTRALILAMPQRSLQLIDQTCSFFADKRVQYYVQSVLPQPSYKLFMAYQSRWWNKQDFYPGPTITDLPLRMTYDFGSEEERGGAPGDKRVLMLASYSDMQAASFWNVLERKEVYTQPPSWSRIASNGGAPAPDTMQRMAESQLVDSLAVAGAAPPVPTPAIGAYYQDWSQDPYGAGYHAWAAHYKAWEAMREVRRPMADRRVYICGEAYSNAQGWVEGAFCTAESVLEEFLQMPRLAGLDAAYPLLSPTPVQPGTQEHRPTHLHKVTKHALF